MNYTATPIESELLEEFVTKGWDRRGYFARLGDSLSQMANVLLANGAPDESMSGRSYRSVILSDSPKLRWRIVRRAANLLFFWQEDHCQLAFWEDVYRSRARGTAADLLDRAVGLRTIDVEGSLGAATASATED